MQVESRLKQFQVLVNFQNRFRGFTGPSLNLSFVMYMTKLLVSISYYNRATCTSTCETTTAVSARTSDRFQQRPACHLSTSIKIDHVSVKTRRPGGHHGLHMSRAQGILRPPCHTGLAVVYVWYTPRLANLNAPSVPGKIPTRIQRTSPLYKTASNAPLLLHRLSPITSSNALCKSWLVFRRTLRHKTPEPRLTQIYNER